MQVRCLLAATAAALTAGACGGAQSPEDAIRETDRAFLAHVQADRVGDACRLTTDHRGCLATFATLRALGMKPSDILEGNEAALIGSMRVAVSGDRARSARGNEWVQRDGRWLKVLKDQR